MKEYLINVLAMSIFFSMVYCLSYYLSKKFDFIKLEKERTFYENAFSDLCFIMIYELLLISFNFIISFLIAVMVSFAITKICDKINK